MNTLQTALAVYELSCVDRERVRDDDLERLQDEYPELRPVFEELQSWRDQE